MKAGKSMRSELVLVIVWMDGELEGPAMDLHKNWLKEELLYHENKAFSILT